MTEAPVSRYSERDLEIFTPEERARFGGRLTANVAWQLLYRLEPDLYCRLIAGERIHRCVLDRLPAHVSRCVEIAAGSGRLTRELIGRCDELIVVEPAAPLRDRLPACDARCGFFDDLPVPDAWADLVVSCSAFSRENGGEPGLGEMQRVTRRDGLIALVWPSDVDWLRSHGFSYESFDDDEMSIEFGSVEEAREIARIFYPHAVDAITDRVVPYRVVGLNPPCDLAWKINR